MNNRNEVMSFDRFDEMVYDHNSKLVDVTIPMREVSYRGQGRIRVQEGTDFGILRAEGRLNKTGYRQLCSRLGAPHQ